MKLLVLAPVTLDFIPGTFKVASFKGIEFGFRSADFADKGLEVGGFRLLPDENGKSEFLDGHRVPPKGQHSKPFRLSRNFLA